VVFSVFLKMTDFEHEELPFCPEIAQLKDQVHPGPAVAILFKYLALVLAETEIPLALLSREIRPGIEVRLFGIIEQLNAFDPA